VTILGSAERFLDKTGVGFPSLIEWHRRMRGPSGYLVDQVRILQPCRKILPALYANKCTHFGYSDGALLSLSLCSLPCGFLGS